jgi:hypothetical protein
MTRAERAFVHSCRATTRSLSCGRLSTRELINTVRAFLRPLMDACNGIVHGLVKECALRCRLIGIPVFALFRKFRCRPNDEPSSSRTPNAQTTQPLRQTPTTNPAQCRWHSPPELRRGSCSCGASQRRRVSSWARPPSDTRAVAAAMARARNASTPEFTTTSRRPCSGASCDLRLRSVPHVPFLLP